MRMALPPAPWSSVLAEGIREVRFEGQPLGAPVNLAEPEEVARLNADWARAGGTVPADDGVKASSLNSVRQFESRCAAYLAACCARLQFRRRNYATLLKSLGILCVELRRGLGALVGMIAGMRWTRLMATT